MNREEKIQFILNHIKDTHNEQDKSDLLEFSNEEINEIYNNILEDNK